MAWGAAIIPDESDLLCESCGYTLRGLALDGRCPECGRSVDESTGRERRLPLWEQSDAGGIFQRFFGTTVLLILGPKRFYRTLLTRVPARAAEQFARIHWVFTAALFATAAYFHTNWYRGSLMHAAPLGELWFIGLFLGAYGMHWAITWASARLTVIEASYRGYRLPRERVLRAMYYHAAHVLPVALVAAGTVLGYQWALNNVWLDSTSQRPYLFVLCVEVVLGAAYLFETYWIAMRNMMYANR